MFTRAHVSMITYRVDVYRSRPIHAFLLTSAGMPGPEGLAHRGWLGMVTGIRLIQILTGGFLVVCNMDACLQGDFWWTCTSRWIRLAVA